MNRIQKTLITCITTLSLCITIIGNITPVTATGDFGGGSGTADDPYIISNAGHLTELATAVNGGNKYENTYFKMDSDITLSGEWDSIGETVIGGFKGTFDGDGHRIDGLTQTNTGTVNVGPAVRYGLFYANIGTIKNLTVSGNISSNEQSIYVGGIVSINQGVIDNCSFEGNITKTVNPQESRRYAVGGIAGISGSENDSSLETTISNCHNSAQIIYKDNEGAYAGGVVGAIINANITNCCNTGEITAQNVTNIANIGGIAGYSYYKAVFEKCYNTGVINGDGCPSGYFGGIIGCFYDTSTVMKITDCYNTGTITGGNTVSNVSVAGIAGYADEINTGSDVITAEIKNCFNTGSLSGANQNDSIYQIAGGNGINSPNNYYLSNPTGISTASLDRAQLFSSTDASDIDAPPIPKTSDQFASGEVAYLLNNSTSGGNVVWRQTLNSDNTPTLDNSHGIVYYNESGGYSNTAPATPTNPPQTTTGRKLYVDFMGRGNAPLTEAPASWSKLDTNDIGNEFWIGVAVDKVHDLDLFTDGIHSLEIAFEYDSQYLQPYYPSGSTDPDVAWTDMLIDGNFADVNDSAFWDEAQYEIKTTTRESELDTINDRENKSLAATRQSSGWKMCTVLVKFKDGVTFDNTRFKDLTDDGKQYLFKFPFMLKKTPSNPNANPTVLSLVRGPETLDIGSGEKGIGPYSAWEATITDPNDATNMKTLFTFGGDIKLFGETASLSDIIPIKPKSGEETQDTEYALSKTPDDSLNGTGFDAEDTDTLDYYLTVPNETDKLKLKIETSDTPTITANNANINSSSNGTYYITDEFDVLELNKDPTTGSADGFNNIVTVEVSGTTYTLHIRRLLKPKIELNPGNSPYGLIERMRDKGWDDDKIQAAKDAFRDSDTEYKTYGQDLVPQDGNVNLRYTVAAWSSYKIKKQTDSGEVEIPVNYDMDPTAVFVYQGEDFTLPKTKAYDDLNNELQPTNVTLKLMRQTKDAACSYVDTKNPTADNITNQVEEYPITPDATGKYSLYNTRIRNDVYFADYEFEYTDVNGVTQTLKESRPVIIIGKLGDLFISEMPVVNDDDMNELSAKTTAIYYGNSLVAYRIADVVSMSSLTDPPVINDDDMNELRAHTTAIYYSTNQYYKSINNLN